MFSAFSQDSRESLCSFTLRGHLSQLLLPGDVFLLVLEQYRGVVWGWVLTPKDFNLHPSLLHQPEALFLQGLPWCSIMQMLGCWQTTNQLWRHLWCAHPLLLHHHHHCYDYYCCYYCHASRALAILGSPNYSQVCGSGPKGEVPAVQAISSPDQPLFL